MLHRPPLLGVLSVCLALATAPAWAADALWRDAPLPSDVPAAGTETDLPIRFRSVLLDRGAFAGDLRRVRRATAAPRMLELPLPNGGSSAFQLEPSDVLPANLAARYPGLASMKGQDAAGRRVRVDIGPDGIHASVSDPEGDWIMRPTGPATARSRSAARPHLVFRRADAPPTTYLETPVQVEATPRQPQATARRSRIAATGTVLRTFRIAVTATPSYTRHMGGTVEDGLAGIMRTVNRVNEIFENDLGVHLVLADNNDRLVFVPGGDDPFAEAGSSDFEMLERNVEVASRVLGDDAFDVGQVFDAQRNTGLAGSLRTTCQTWNGDPDHRAQSKAGAISGSTRPFGDLFHVNLVAHELGHQFGAQHTFNGCTAVARSESGAFSPGSGSTVMSYAASGLCESHRLQSIGDPYFHAGNIEQVGAWTASSGGACAVPRINRLPAPFLDTAGWHRPLIVPARTPFSLDGIATFAAPTAQLTYTFEQMDLGPAQKPDMRLADTGEGPLFRSRPPHPEGYQTFPAMSVLLGEEPLGLGDAFPASNRELRFRMTVRDNLDQQSHTVSAERVVRVVDTGGSFEVLLPKAAAVLRRGRSSMVRWNVARTNLAPIACKSVDISLFVDGGKNFDETLAEAVPNNGRHRITLPAGLTPTRRSRLRIDCTDDSLTGGSFFALSGEFEIR